MNTKEQLFKSIRYFLKASDALKKKTEEYSSEIKDALINESDGFQEYVKNFSIQSYKMSTLDKELCEINGIPTTKKEALSVSKAVDKIVEEFKAFKASLGDAGDVLFEYAGVAFLVNPKTTIKSATSMIEEQLARFHKERKFSRSVKAI